MTEQVTTDDSSIDSAASALSAGLEVRPCLRTLAVSGVTLTPDDINMLASSGNFASWLHGAKIKGKDFTAAEIYEVAEAIHDNWSRYWASC